MIDSHHHFWNYTAKEFGWVTDDMSVLKQDFLPQQLEQAIAGTEVAGVVTVQARPCIQETDWLLDLAAQNHRIKGVVGWVPLKDSAIGDELDRLTDHPLFKGVREIVQGQPDEQFLDCPDFHCGMRELTARGIPFDLLIFHDQLASATRFVDAHPNQRFILDHIAKPEIQTIWPEQWASEIRELARRENVVCKFSGVTTEVREPSWNAGLILPYFETVLEAFGATRVMFGSDWPVCLLRTSYAGWISAVKEFAATLSAGEREAFFSTNARSAYGLSED